MTATTRKGDWIQTFTGRQFWPLDPRPEDIDLEDVAHALSNLCRFTGHCREFYSVGEHSVRVSWACDPGDAVWGLLHDASEAYIADMSRPVKGNMPAYKAMERVVMAAVCERFGLAIEEPASVKRADNVLLFTEARDLMCHPPNAWRDIAVPLPEPIEPWEPKKARRRFLDRAADLGVR